MGPSHSLSMDACSTHSYPIIVYSITVAVGEDFSSMLEYLLCKRMSQIQILASAEDGKDLTLIP